jgi:hypothetical protein
VGQNAVTDARTAQSAESDDSRNGRSTAHLPSPKVNIEAAAITDRYVESVLRRYTESIEFQARRQVPPGRDCCPTPGFGRNPLTS